MHKICLVPVMLWLAACATERKPVSLPAAVDGGWKLKASGPIAMAEAPGKIPLLKPSLMVRGTYDGPTAIEVELYQFRNATGAFEALQSWQPDGKRMVAHHGDVFVAAHSPQPDRSAVETFLNNLRKTF